jgi:hypothetical protein
MAKNAEQDSTTELDPSALENINWDEVEAIDPKLADLLRLSVQQLARAEEQISKGVSEKKQREPQTLAARVNRALTTEPKGLNRHGVTIANTGASPDGDNDIDNSPILDGLVQVIEECGGTVDRAKVVMGDHFLAFALLVYNLAETRAWQPKKEKGEAEATTAPVAVADQDEDDEDDQ